MDTIYGSVNAILNYYFQSWESQLVVNKEVWLEWDAVTRAQDCQLRKPLIQSYTAISNFGKVHSLYIASFQPAVWMNG